jgi:cell division protein FtsQ
LKTPPPVRPAAAGLGVGSAVIAAGLVTRRARGEPLGRPGTPAVDPRISARRIAVRREEGQRRLRRLLWLGGGIGVLAVLLAVTRTPLLDLDHLTVAGTDDPAVVAALDDAGIRLGDPLTDLDLRTGERALEALPQVSSAELWREWPGTLRVEVEPRLPVAAVAVAGGTALVAADGVVVTVTSEPTALVRVAGPHALAAGDRLDALPLLAVAARLPESLRAEVAGIAAGDGAGAVELHLHDGSIVRLGAADQLDDKLPAAVTVLSQVDRSCVQVIDVRVPSVPTVTRSRGC